MQSLLLAATFSPHVLLAFSRAFYLIVFSLFAGKDLLQLSWTGT